MLTFPDLSRAPDPDEEESTIDPTLRDPMEDGAEDTALRFTRGRRQWETKIAKLTRDDKAILDRFVRVETQYGALPFRFWDNSDPADPEMRIVKFGTLPSYKRTEWTVGGFRYDATFTLREE